jgi:hypothetical protein
MSKAEFELFLNFFDTIGDKYKQGLEKYVKSLEYNDAYLTRAPWYGPIKQAIPNLYSILKGALSRKTIWIPSIQWINYGITLPDNAEYSINLGYEAQSGSIQKSAVDNLLDLQHHFESEVFEPTLNALKAEYAKKIVVYRNRRAAQETASTSEAQLVEEFNRQRADPKFKLHIQKGDKKGYNMITVSTAYNANQYSSWLPQFKASKEWKEYLAGKSKSIEKEYASELNAKEKERLKGLETGTFYAANIYEDADVDSINYDVIQKLKEQEAAFNKALGEAKVGYDKIEEDRKKLLAESLQKLKDRIAQEQGDIFKKLDIAIKKNEENDKKREIQKEAKQKEAQDEVSEQRALGSLSNYTSCSSNANNERWNKVQDQVYEDADIQQLIDDSTQHILTGTGRRKLTSIAKQMYLLNKRFINHNRDDAPVFRFNNARKAKLIGGSDELDTAATVFDVAGAVFPPLAIIGAILSVINIFDEKARAEAEKKRIEEEERQARLFDSWKDDTIATTVATLEGETDEDKFEERKREMINNMFETSKGEISQDDLDRLLEEIDDAHTRTMEQRQQILDQYTENTKQIIIEVDDLKGNYEDNIDKIDEENNKARDEILKPFVDALKAKADEYEKQAKSKEDIRVKQEEYEKKVNERLNGEYDKLDAETEKIKELKGYSGCSSNATNLEAAKKKIQDDIKREAAAAEEAKAQGVPIEEIKTGAGRVNTRQAIVKRIMQSKGMSMIQASKYVKEKGLYKK